ncbi:hypothetical protein QR685DRAFT_247844 [Neurospora intermedia]|uniref:Uncharacterized protein n=1 Tax=Neurospora intermedia TaxID=5142 RepID=A0ABR3DC44_NEUIN
MMTVTLSTRLCTTPVSIFLSSGQPIRVVSDAGIELNVKWDGGSGPVAATAIRENPKEGGGRDDYNYSFVVWWCYV